MTDAACCADCTSFPLSFNDQIKFCRSVMDSVSFLHPACDKQPERARASLDIEKLKIYQARKMLANLSGRLQRGLDRVHRVEEARQYDKALNADLEAYRCGEHDQLLNRTHDGMVYAVRCGDFVKIGHTRTPINQRICGLRNGNPFELTLIGMCPGTVSTERRFHKILEEHRHRNEWFRADERFLRRIRRLIVMEKGNFFKVIPRLTNPLDTLIIPPCASARKVRSL